MNWPHALSILAVAYLAVFAESRFAFLRNTLGAQVDALPALVVYAGLSAGLPTVTVVAVISGLWYDALSAHPLGPTMVPLTAAGLMAHAARGMVLRRDAWTQFLLGAGACAGVPLVSVGLLIAAGEEPLYGGWFAWRWLVGAILGGALTPVFFRLFDLLHRALDYPLEPSQAFRPDREIDRGRDLHVHH
jgi:cell shape-determining protein MreD